jgi:hypothetical protein
MGYLLVAMMGKNRAICMQVAGALARVAIARNFRDHMLVLQDFLQHRAIRSDHWSFLNQVGQQIWYLSAAYAAK